jgi:outer membrane protein insertion porin family
MSFQRAESIYGKCENAPSLVSAVQFHGVEKTKHDAIVKEINELYNSKNVDELIKNSNLAAKHMLDVGLFEGVTPLIDGDPHSKESYVVNFVVKEPTAVSLGAKIGMTTQGDADACLTGGKQSFNGRGESIDASYSKTIRGGNSFNLSINKPFLGWQRYTSIGASLYQSYESLRWNKAEFGENGLILRYNGQIFNNKVKHSLKFNNLWRTFYPSTNSPFAVREHAGHSTKFSIENSVGVDARDRPILPSKGYYANLTQEHAGLIGDASFMRHQIDLQAAAPFLLGSFVSATLQCNLVQPMAGKTLHLLDRAYLGGPHDIRGFDIRSIGPQSKKASLGGGASFAVAAHIYRPLRPADMVYLHGFMSAGTVSSLRSTSWMKDIIETPRVSAGLGVAVVFKNLVRFELNYVMPLRYTSNDSIAPGIQFGAGLNFL